MFKPVLLGIFCLTILISCSPREEEKASDQKNKKEVLPKSQTTKAESSTNKKVEKILKNYYQALESEDAHIGDFFAPIVERFYHADSFTQAKVLQSLQQSFKSVDSRSVELDWESLSIKEEGNQTIATFKGKTSFTDVKSSKQREAAFFNQITFDEDLRILRYENAEEVQKTTEATRQINQEGSDGLGQTVLLVSRAIKTGKINLLKSLIHPDHGFYLISQPGAFSVPDELSGVEELSEKAAWMSKGNNGFCGIPQVGELPGFNCETQFSRQGCFFSKIPSPYAGLSELMEALGEAEISRFENHSMQKAKKLEKLVSHQMIDTETATSLLFGKIDGQWYVLIIDTATYNCSA